MRIIILRVALDVPVSVCGLGLATRRIYVVNSESTQNSTKSDRSHTLFGQS